MEREVEIKNVDKYTDSSRGAFQNSSTLENPRFILKLAESNSVIIKPNEKNRKFTEITILAKGSVHEINSKYKEFKAGTKNLDTVNKPSNPSKGKSKGPSEKHKRSCSHSNNVPKENNKMSIETSIKTMEEQILQLSRSYNRMKNNKEDVVSDDKPMGPRDFIVYETSVPCKVAANLQNQQIYATSKARTMSHLKIALACQNARSSTHEKHCVCQHCNIMGVVMESQKKVMEEHGPPPPRNHLQDNQRPSSSNRSPRGRADEFKYEMKPLEKETTDAKKMRRVKNGLFINDLALRIKRLEDKEVENSHKFLDKEHFKSIMRTLILHTKQNQKDQLSCVDQTDLLYQKHRAHQQKYPQNIEVPSKEKSASHYSRGHQESICIGHVFSNHRLNNSTPQPPTLERESGSSGLAFNSTFLPLVEDALTSDVHKLELLKMSDHYNNFSGASSSITAFHCVVDEDVKESSAKEEPERCVSKINLAKSTKTLPLYSSKVPSVVLEAEPEPEEYAASEKEMVVSNFSALMEASDHEDLETIEHLDVNFYDNVTENGEAYNPGRSPSNADEEQQELSCQEQNIRPTSEALTHVTESPVSPHISDEYSKRPKSAIPVRLSDNADLNKKSTAPGERKILRRTQIPKYVSPPRRSFAEKKEPGAVDKERKESKDKEAEMDVPKNESPKINLQSRQKTDVTVRNCKPCERKKAANDQNGKLVKTDITKSEITNRWVKETADYVRKRTKRKEDKPADRERFTTTTGKGLAKNSVKKKAVEPPSSTNAAATDEQKEKIWKYICRKIEKVDQCKDSSFNVILELESNDPNGKPKDRDAGLKLSMDDVQMILKDSGMGDEIDQSDPSETPNTSSDVRKDTLKKRLVNKLAKFNKNSQPDDKFKQ